MSKKTLFPMEVKDKYGFEHKMHVVETESPSWEGRLACYLVERWGMVAGVEDGEDSAGRAKIRLTTPDELVARALEVAEKTTKAIREKGWTIHVPFPTGYTLDVDGVVRQTEKTKEEGQ